MATNKTIQFLRNGTAYTSKQAAITALKAMTPADGSLLMGRYTDGEAIKTILAAYSNSPMGQSCTIFDVDNDALTAILNYTVNGKKISENPVLAAGDITVGGAGTYKDNTVLVAIEGLDARIKAAVSGGVTSVVQGDYITVDATDVNNPKVSANVQDIATATAAKQGFADAKNVKDYVNAAVEGKNVAAEGETGAAALVSASAADNKVTVASTTKLQNAVTAAESAVQSVSKGTDGANGYFTTTIDATDSKNPKVSGAVKVSSLEAATKAGDGLADAYEVAQKFTTVENAGKVTVTPTDGGTTDAFLKKYTIYQGGTAEANKIGEINIPKDLVVTSGSVITVTAADKAIDSSLVVGEKAIKLVIANQETPIYIPAKSLVDIYTAEQNATSVQVAVSDANVISATIVDGAVSTEKIAASAVTTAKIADKNVTEAKLADDLLAKINAASTKTTVVAKDDATYTDVTKVDGESGLVTYTVKNKVVALADATDANKGVAEAKDVKDYVNTAVANKNVAAEGDEYVSATATNNKVTVAATEAMKASLGKADDALQSVSGQANANATDTNYVSLTAGAKDAAKNQALSVGLTIQAVASASADNKGLAEASDVKAYVDGKVTDLTNAINAVNVKGTAQQITVTKADDKNEFTVKFADDAVFDCGEF